MISFESAVLFQESLGEVGDDVGEVIAYAGGHGGASTEPKVQTTPDVIGP